MGVLGVLKLISPIFNIDFLKDMRDAACEATLGRRRGVAFYAFRVPAALYRLHVTAYNSCTTRVGRCVCKVWYCTSQ